MSKPFNFCIVRIVWYLLISFFIFSCSTHQVSQRAPGFFKSTDPSGVEISRPEVERWKLENGLTLLFLEDNELPIISGELVMPGGIYWEEPSMPGVVSAMGSMMRTGGTQALAPDLLNEELRQLAASISSSYSGESGSVSFSCLTSELDRVFSLFSDVVQRPRFDQERLDVLKTASLSEIRKRKEEPDKISSLTARMLLHRNSPRGRILSSSDVKNLQREKLIAAHQKFVRPDGAYLVFSGAVNRKRIESLVEKHFGEWSARGSDLGEPQPLREPHPPGIYFVEGDFTQSNVYAVQPGPPRFASDMFPINLLNNILGDGLDSRVFKKVRSDLGLAYGVAAVLNRNFQVGRNLIYIKTKTDSTVKALTAALAEIKLVQEEVPGEKELSLMKQAAQSSFVFQFDSPMKILSRIVTLELFKYPQDYDDTYISNTFAVTPTEVSETAKRWWKLDQLRYVIVGSKKAYDIVKREVKNDEILSKLPIRKLSFDELPKGL